jgi:hypothetical protein
LANLEKNGLSFVHSDNAIMATQRDAEKAVALALAVAAPVSVAPCVVAPEVAVVGGTVGSAANADVPPTAAVVVAPPTAVVVVVPPTAAVVVVVPPTAVVVVPAVVVVVVGAGAALHSRKLSHRGAVALHAELQHGTVSDGLQNPLIFAQPSAFNVGDEMYCGLC